MTLFYQTHTNKAYRIYFQFIPLDGINHKITEIFHFNIRNGLLPINISIFVPALSVLNQSLFEESYKKYERTELFNIIRKRRYRGTLFLYVACQNGHENIVRTILNCPRIDVNQHQNYKDGNIADTPLHISCQNGHLGIVRLLLKINGIKIDQVKKDGSTPFYSACKFGHVEIANELLSTSRVDVNRTDSSKMSALYVACQNGHVEVVAFLLGIPKIMVNLAEEDEVTPLFVACQNGYVDIVKLLIARVEVDINLTQESGLSPFFIACQNGHVDIVVEMSDRPGLKVNTPPEVSKCFIAACGSGEKILQILASKWSRHDINSSYTMAMNSSHSETLTPLIQACHHGYEGSILWLLKKYKGRIKDNVVFKGKSALGWYLQSGGTSQIIIEELKALAS